MAARRPSPGRVEFPNFRSLFSVFAMYEPEYYTQELVSRGVSVRFSNESSPILVCVSTARFSIKMASTSFILRSLPPRTSSIQGKYPISTNKVRILPIFR